MSKGIVYLQYDGTISFINDEAFKIFRNFFPFAIGGNILQQSWKLSGEDGQALSLDDFPANVVLRSGKPKHNCEIRIENETGYHIRVHMDVDPVGSNNGTSRGAIITVKKVAETERKENIVIGNFLLRKEVTGLPDAQIVSELSHYLKLVLENTDEAMTLVDRDLKLIVQNKIGKELTRLLFGTETKEGEDLSNFYPKENWANLNNLLRRTLIGEKIEQDMVFHLKDGSIRAFFTVFRPVTRDNAIKWVLITSIDITEKYELQHLLEQSNRRFELAFKATKDIVFEYDCVASKIIFNNSLYEMLGYDPAEVITRTFARSLVHPDDLPMLLANKEKFFRGSDNIFSHPDFRMVHKNGTIIYVEIKFFATRNIKGEIVECFGNIRNVTERYLMQEQLQKSLELFDLAFKASFDILWDINTEQQTIYLSQASEASFGITGAVTMSLDDIFKMIHQDDVNPIKQALEDFAVNTGKTNADVPDHRVLKSDGSYAFVKAKMYGMRNDKGALLRIIGVTSDITTLKKYQHELEKLNMDCEKQAIELKKSNEDLERFAYVASHDLQEPLRMVSSFLSLIRKRYINVLDEDGVTYINYAVDGALRMKQLILDLLQFSRISTNKEKKETVNTLELIKTLEKGFVVTITEKKAQINIQHLPDILANKSQIIQVFQNLLSNALKYCKEAPVIELGGTEKPTHWEFYVKDNGIGIEPKYFEKIFIIFKRLHNKSEYSGTGIGLAIVKRIIEQHSGKIWIDSIPGKGSSFYFTIAKN